MAGQRSETQSDHDLLLRVDERLRAVDTKVDALMKSGDTYATKEELSVQTKRLDRLMAGGASILVAVTTALIVAFLKIAGKGL